MPQLDAWPDELLVKMVRAVRASYEIDDGHASDNWHNAWRQMGHYSKVRGPGRTSLSLCAPRRGVREAHACRSVAPMRQRAWL